MNVKTGENRLEIFVDRTLIRRDEFVVASMPIEKQRFTRRRGERNVRRLVLKKLRS